MTKIIKQAALALILSIGINQTIADEVTDDITKNRKEIFLMSIYKHELLPKKTEDGKTSGSKVFYGRVARVFSGKAKVGDTFSGIRLGIEAGDWPAWINKPTIIMEESELVYVCCESIGKQLNSNIFHAKNCLVIKVGLTQLGQRFQRAFPLE
jgi:hypothetical protein